MYIYTKGGIRLNLKAFIDLNVTTSIFSTFIWKPKAITISSKAIKILSFCTDHRMPVYVESVLNIVKVN